MDITRIKLVGRTTVDLPIEGLNLNSPFVLKDVDGLGPPEFTNYETSRKPANRQLIFRIGLNPAVGQTVGALRAQLYGMLSPSRRLQDRFEVGLFNGDTGIASTRGRIKTFPVSPFSKSTDVQITMECDDLYNGPYLMGNLTATYNTLTKATPTINYVGTAETGFLLSIKFTGPSSYWSIKDDNVPLADGTPWRMRLNYPFVAEDTLIINSRPGEKEITLYHEGLPVPLYSALTADSEWLMLQPGVNKYVTSSQNFNWEGPGISYRIRDWGI